MGPRRLSGSARRVNTTLRELIRMSLPMREFYAKGYRSLKAIAYPMSDLDVFVGQNGIGKTNLYRALELLQSAATNDLARHLSREGALTRPSGQVCAGRGLNRLNSRRDSPLPIKGSLPRPSTAMRL